MGAPGDSPTFDLKTGGLDLLVLRGTPTTAGAFFKVISINGGCHVFQAFGHCHRRCSDDGGHCVGSKQHGQKDTRPHDAKPPGEEYRSGSFRIRAGSPQAQQIAISI
jgi:hypothetical protein